MLRHPSFTNGTASFDSACAIASAFATANATADANAKGKTVMRLTAEITFPKGYIAHPYWPELEKLINIQKESGTRRARSADKAVKVLRDYLATRGMSMEDYERLAARAARPFYTVADLNGVGGDRPADEIVIPSHQFYGALAQACDLAGSALRIAKLDQLRTVLSVDSVFTGKVKPDGVWDRFVVVKAGAGQKLSNQRALRSNPYLGPFTGEWSVEFSEETLSPQRVRDFLTFAGREIGVGASRKLGWGRFTLSF